MLNKMSKKTMKPANLHFLRPISTHELIINAFGFPLIHEAVFGCIGEVVKIS